MKYSYLNHDSASERHQLEAVRESEVAISFIAQPSEAVQIAAVKSYPFALGRIDNPSKAVQLAAVKAFGPVITYIDDPCEEVQIAAVIADVNAVLCIRNITTSVRLLAILLYTLPYPKILTTDPNYAVQLAMAGQWAWAMLFVNDPPEELQLLVIKKDHEAFHSINNPSPSAQKLYEELTAC